MLGRRHVIPLGVFALFATVAPVLAGPPLLCHPFDIGDARSLPWGPDWSQGRSEYNVANLVADTEAILTPTAPVIVRMETLRRAALYASLDGKVARQLLQSLNARATAAERAGNSSPATAMALLSWLMAIDGLRSRWTRTVRTVFPVAASHAITRPSSPVVTISDPSALKVA